MIYLLSLLFHLGLLTLLDLIPWRVRSVGLLRGKNEIKAGLVLQLQDPVRALTMEKTSPRQEIQPMARHRGLEEELLISSDEIALQEPTVNPLRADELQELAPVKEPGGPKAGGRNTALSELLAESSSLESPSLFGQGAFTEGSGKPSRDGGLPGGGGGLEEFKGSFDAYLGVLKRTGLDVVFVFDSTGSMEWVIEEVKAKIANLVGVIKRLVPIARVGIVTYRDRGEDYVTRMRHLTIDLNQLKAFLNEVKAEGGGDPEEAVEEGLRVAVEEIRWRKGSKKMIILIGDEPPHKDDLPKALSLAEKFHHQQGGFVSAIDASHETNDETFSNYDSHKILPAFAAIVEKGGGETANLKDKKIIKQLVILTFGSRWKEVMDEYTKDL